MAEGGDVGKGSRRGPSYRGRVMLDHVRGVPRARGWPKKRKKGHRSALTPQQDWFLQAQWASKYWEPSLQVEVTKAVHGTPLLPRDLMTMIMAGRAYSVTIVGRGTIYSVEAMTDVSDWLDVITAQPGYTLVRGVNNWVGTPAAPVNEGSRIFGTVTPPATLTSGSSFATKGLVVEPLFDVNIYNLLCRLSLVSGGTYQFSIYRLNTTNQIQSIIAQSSVITATASGVQQLKPDCIGAILAGQKYFLALTRTNGGNTYALPTPTQPGGTISTFVGLPLGGTNSGRLAKQAPAIGDTVDVQVGSVGMDALGVVTS